MERGKREETKTKYFKEVQKTSKKQRNYSVSSRKGINYKTQIFNKYSKNCGAELCSDNSIEYKWKKCERKDEFIENVQREEKKG